MRHSDAAVCLRQTRAVRSRRTGSLAVWLLLLCGPGPAQTYRVPISAPANTPGGIDLSGVYKIIGIYSEGTTFPVTSGLDSTGAAFSASTLGSQVTWNGSTFALGPPNAPNAASQATIAVSGQGERLDLLATAVNGNQEDQSFTVRYADGSSSRYTQSVSDWYTPQKYPGEAIAVSAPYRIISNGGRQTGPFHLYGYSFRLDANKSVSAVVLPANPRVLLLAMNLAVGATPPVITSVVNAAGYQPVIASGAWVSIKGFNLAPDTRGEGRTWTGADFSGSALPLALDGVSVSINGKKAYVYYVSPTQINVLAPGDATLGSVPVQVTTSKGSSNIFSVTKQGVSPALFPLNATYGIATAGNVLIGPAGYGAPSTRPALPGEIISLWATGLGPTTPPYPEGVIVTLPVALSSGIQVTIGGVTALPVWSGLSATGLYQVNLAVPNVPAGDQPVVITINEVRSPDKIFLPIGGR